MRKLVLLLAVFALTMMGVTAATSAEAMRGFSGRAAGEATFVLAPEGSGCQYPTPESPWQTISDGAGTAAHMGQVVVHFEHCSGNDLDGVGTIDGAKGDVYVSYSGPCTPFVPGVTTLVECDLDFEVTGGSDRYDDASGGGELDAVVIPQPEGAWPATWTWKGKISY